MVCVKTESVNIYTKAFLLGGITMKQRKPRKKELLKTVYEEPSVDIIKFSFRDIVSTSGPWDENQGEWDPQEYSNYPVY